MSAVAGKTSEVERLRQFRLLLEDWDAKSDSEKKKDPNALFKGKKIQWNVVQQAMVRIHINLNCCSILMLLQAGVSLGNCKSLYRLHKHISDENFALMLELEEKAKSMQEPTKKTTPKKKKGNDDSDVEIIELPKEEESRWSYAKISSKAFTNSTDAVMKKAIISIQNFAIVTHKNLTMY